MLKIGDLARRTDVSVKTLRHYAELGLLKPVWIDRFTGYRYYQPDQVAHLERIRALKKLGFSLIQIKELLDPQLSSERLAAMLRSKIAELSAHMRLEQDNLGVLAGWLQQLDGSAAGIQALLPLQPVAADAFHQPSVKEFAVSYRIVTLPAFSVIGMCYHGLNKHNEIQAMWGRFLQRLDEIDRINPTIAYGLCSAPAFLQEGYFEYVAGVQVNAGARLPEGMVLRQLPELKYAVFAHHGLLKTLDKTYGDIYQVQLPASGLEVFQLGMDMEVYTEEWIDDTPDSVLYIYVPVK